VNDYNLKLPDLWIKVAQAIRLHCERKETRLGNLTRPFNQDMSKGYRSKTLHLR
jgi:hypothetical protein